MLNRQEMIDMIGGAEVLFLGLVRDNVMLNINMETDINGNHYIGPYIGKTCRVIGQDLETDAIECEFVACDMEGNVINNGMTTIEIDFNYTAYTDAIDYDPVFERIPTNLP